MSCVRFRLLTRVRESEKAPGWRFFEWLGRAAYPFRSAAAGRPAAKSLIFRRKPGGFLQNFVLAEIQEAENRHGWRFSSVFAAGRPVAADQLVLSVALVVAARKRQSLFRYGLEELVVRARLRHLVENELGNVAAVEHARRAPQHPDLAHLDFAEQQLFVARTRALDVDGREDARFGEFAGQVELHVARALELFEDHVVHLGAGLDERGSDDGERTALFDFARRAEEPLRFMERGRIQTA